MIQELSQVKFGGMTHRSVAVLDDQRQVIAPVTMYLAHLSLYANSHHTIKNYAYRLNTFFEVLGASEIDWKKVTNDEMDIYLNRFLYEEKNLIESSIAGHVAAISSFYEYVWEYGYLETPIGLSYSLYDQGVKTQPSTESNHTPLLSQYIEDDKYELLLANCSGETPFLLERNELILKIGYRLGLRAEEVVDERNLRISDLEIAFGDQGEQKIWIVGKGRKQRRMPIPHNLMEDIKRFMAGRRKKVPGNNLICSEKGKTLSRSTASIVFRDAANNTLDKSFDAKGFHSLRHTFATNTVADCYNNGMDPWILVPDLMGHTSRKTTFRYVYFDAVLRQRHSVLKDLAVKREDIRKRK